MITRLVSKRKKNFRYIRSMYDPSRIIHDCATFPRVTAKVIVPSDSESPKHLWRGEFRGPYRRSIYPHLVLLQSLECKRAASTSICMDLHARQPCQREPRVHTSPLIPRPFAHRCRDHVQTLPSIFQPDFPNDFHFENFF